MCIRDRALIGAAGGIDEEAMVQAVIGPLVGVLGLRCV